jgi:hypothetical protein
VNRALENRLGKLETALNMRPDGGPDDLDVEVVSAERRERGFRALVALLATRPDTEARIAVLEATFMPGPVQQRSTVAGRAAFAALLAKRP